MGESLKQVVFEEWALSHHRQERDKVALLFICKTTETLFFLVTFVIIVSVFDILVSTPISETLSKLPRIPIWNNSDLDMYHSE